MKFKTTPDLKQAERKDIIYCLIFLIGIISMALVFSVGGVFALIAFIESGEKQSLIWIILYFIGVIFSIVVLVVYIVGSRKTYCIQEGRLIFRHKQVDLSAVSCILITKWIDVRKFTIKRNEIKEGKIIQSGYIYFLNQISEWKIPKYGSTGITDLTIDKEDVIYSAWYQSNVLKCVLNEGFCGKIYLSRSFYELRKEDFNLLFSGSQFPTDNLILFDGQEDYK